MGRSASGHGRGGRPGACVLGDGAPPPDSFNYAAWYGWYEEGGLDTKRNLPPYVKGGALPLIFQERAPSVRRPRYAPNPNAMTHEQAEAIAESEGLKLMMSNANSTGYLYVHPSGSHSRDRIPGWQEASPRRLVVLGGRGGAGGGARAGPAGHRDERSRATRPNPRRCRSKRSKRRSRPRG